MLLQLIIFLFLFDFFFLSIDLKFVLNLLFIMRGVLILLVGVFFSRQRLIALRLRRHRNLGMFLYCWDCKVSVFAFSLLACELLFLAKLDSHASQVHIFALIKRAVFACNSVLRFSIGIVG